MDARELPLANGSVPHDGAELERTDALLRRHHDGDPQALPALLCRDLAWVRAHVHRHLYGAARLTADTDDLVGDVMMAVLANGPRFVLSSKQKFRALIATIVRNRLISLARGATAAGAAEVAHDGILDLDRDLASAATPPPDRAAQREREAYVGLALELIHPDDRDVIHQREWNGLPFADLGQRLGISAPAARMRFNTAVKRLYRYVVLLEHGRLDELLAAAGGPAEP